MNSRSQGRQRGLTMIEACICLAISATTLGLAVPGFEQLRERHDIEGAAAQFETDVAYARSLAVARNENLRITFVGSACYVVHTGTQAECSCAGNGSASCGDQALVLHTVALHPAAKVNMASNSASMLLDADRGTVSPTGTVRFTGHSGVAVHAIVNIMGRVRNCSPAPALPGYATC